MAGFFGQGVSIRGIDRGFDKAGLPLLLPPTVDGINKTPAGQLGGPIF
jgi:uncharacterized protein YbcC (UPF0753/DUF2309 family)